MEHIHTKNRLAFSFSLVLSFGCRFQSRSPTHSIHFLSFRLVCLATGGGGVVVVLLFDDFGFALRLHMVTYTQYITFCTRGASSFFRPHSFPSSSLSLILSISPLAFSCSSHIHSHTKKKKNTFYACFSNKIGYLVGVKRKTC